MFKIKKPAIVIILGLLTIPLIKAGGSAEGAMSNKEESVQSVQAKMDSMDKEAAKVKSGLDSMDIKIKDAERKIKMAENEKLLKPNYFWPLVGGAVAGLALAVIIRRRKKKQE